MQIEEGTSFELSDGTWSRPAVTLNDSDFAQLMTEWGVPVEKRDSLSLRGRYTILSVYGQYLMVVNQVQAKSGDKAWMESAGQPMFQAASEKLQKVRESLS
jgi:hypothetical protein